MPKRKPKPDRMPLPPVHTLRLKKTSYQPSKAELDEEIHIDATPEELAKAALRQVKIERDD